MKNICLLLIAFTIITFQLSIIHAQAPQFVNYQAVARNAAGNALPNQQITVRLTIHNNTPTGAIAYIETDTVTTNQFGLFTIAVGRGTTIPGGFSGIAWGSGNKYLQVEMDPTAGSSFADMGTTQLLSVPYALHAETSDDNNWSESGNHIYKTNSGNVGIGTTTPSDLLELSALGTSGLLKLTSNMGSTQITMNDAGADDVYLTSTMGQFDIWTGGNNQRVTVLPSGNVGIGTTTPSDLLELSGIGTSGLLKLTSNVSSTQITMNDVGADDVYLTSTLGRFDIWTGGNFERLSVLPNGNVGIGSTSPLSLLHVKDANTSPSGSQIIIEANSGFGGATYSALEFRSNPSSTSTAISGRIVSYYQSPLYTSATTTFQTVAGGPTFVDAMSLQNGNVGIGTTAPASKLEVNGTVLISGSGEVNRSSTGASNLVPIAYGGYFFSGPTANSGNVSIVWNGTNMRYEITITGENYFYANYVTVVTPLSATYTVTTGSVGGMLLISFRNTAGTAVQGDFQFVTYKP